MYQPLLVGRAPAVLFQVPSGSCVLHLHAPQRLRISHAPLWCFATTQLSSKAGGVGLNIIGANRLGEHVKFKWQLGYLSDPAFLGRLMNALFCCC